MIRNDMKKEQERLAKYEKNVSKLCVCMEKYLEAAKAMYEAENILSEEIKVFYSQEESDQEIIMESAADCGMKLAEVLNEEKTKCIPLLETIRGSIITVNQEYQRVFNTFKKRFSECQDIDKQTLLDDFELFEEQRYENTDNLMLLYLKLKDVRSTIPFKHLTVGYMSGAATENPDTIVANCANMVNNVHGIKYFRTFLAKEFSVENLDFWVEANAFKSLTDTELMEKKGKEIYNLFIREGSEKELNISSQHSKKIRAFIDQKQFSSIMFDEVLHSIFQLIQTDSFPRFKQDSLFTRLKKRIKKRDFVNYKPQPPLSPLSPSSFKDPNRLRVNSGEQRKVKDDILTERDWMLILSSAEVVAYAKNARIFTRGEQLKYFFKIKSGTVRLEDADNNLLNTLGEGDILGELPLMEYPNLFNAIAHHSTKTELYRVDVSVLNALLQVDTAFSERFCQLVCTKVAFHIHALPLRSAISKMNEEVEDIIDGLVTRQQKPKSNEVEDGSQRMNTGVDQKAEEKDQKVGELFGIKDDVVVKEYQCSMKKKFSVHGHLFVLGKHVAFYSKVFGSVTRIVEAFIDIENIESQPPRKIVVHTVKKQKYTFRFPESSEDAHRFICTLWHPIAATRSTTPQVTINVLHKEYRPKKYSGSLKEEGWEKIFECAKRSNYSKNQVILRQGEPMRALFQIVQGECRVEIGDDQKTVLGKMSAGEIFGEITYLFGGGATVSIVADSNPVRIYSIDRTALQELFTSDMELCAKFYRFLASQISKRVIPKTLLATASRKVPISLNPPADTIPHSLPLSLPLVASARSARAGSNDPLRSPRTATPVSAKTTPRTPSTATTTPTGTPQKASWISAETASTNSNSNSSSEEPDWVKLAKERRKTRERSMSTDKQDPPVLK